MPIAIRTTIPPTIPHKKAKAGPSNITSSVKNSPAAGARALAPAAFGGKRQQRSIQPIGKAKAKG